MAQGRRGSARFCRAFERGSLDREALSAFDRPVYVALGGPEQPDQYAEIAERVSRVFPNVEFEVFEERHHLDPPHRAEPERLARSLESLWRSADSQQA